LAHHLTMGSRRSPKHRSIEVSTGQLQRQSPHQLQSIRSLQGPQTNKTRLFRQQRSQAVMTACPREVCFTLASRPLAFVATPTRRATKYASQLGKLNVSAPPRASGALDVLRIHPVGAVRDRGVVKGAVQRALGDGLEREPLAVHCIDRVDGRREHVGIIYNFFGRGHQLAPHGPSPKIARLIV
jgi:hypothetical protein